MDAAIEKILSENIDVDAEEVPDFREGESGSDAESGSDIESSEEEEEEASGSGSDDDGKLKKEAEEEDSEDDEDEEQDALDADLAPSSEEDEDKDDAEEEDTSEDDEGGLGGGLAPGGRHGEEEPAGFLEGGKSETFARAFARIIESSAPQTEQVLAAPILAGSKSLAARKAEDEAEAKAHRAAKKLRLEMRQRGHVVPKRRGADPTADAREKSFQKTATRGVVRLFNAVAKAQRRLREEEGVSGSRAKAAKLGKASFLAELRNSKAANEGKSEAVVPSARPTSEAAAAVAAGGAGGGDGSDEEGGAGWAVLQQGFTGLHGGNKMKDWDKQMSEDESEPGAGGAGESSDDDE